MTFIIAEIGVNHNGDIELAHKLIDAAYECGASAVKFQTFDCEKLEPPGDRREMLRKLQLTTGRFRELKDYCGTRIEFMSTPFDVDALWELVSLGVERIKISSGGLFDMALLKAAEESQLPIILSTGMATENDVSKAMWRLKYSDKLTLLHCNSGYPTPYEDVNLRAMQTLKNSFGCPVGLSDHTIGISVPIAATALGAVVIEKHITLDKNMAGPDHAISLEPPEFKKMVLGIREIEKAMGDGVKRQTPSEQKTVGIVRERQAWAA